MEFIEENCNDFSIFIMKNGNLEDEIKKFLKKIKLILKKDGGDVEFVSFDSKKGILKLKLEGACSYCPFSKITLKTIIEAKFKDKFPKIKFIETV